MSNISQLVIGSITYGIAAATVQVATSSTLGGIKVSSSTLVPAANDGYNQIRIDANGAAYYHDTTYSAATPAAGGIGGTSGLLTGADKEKIDGMSSTYALKSEIVGFYKYKGSVNDIGVLPLSDNSTGDVYNVQYRYELLDTQPIDWTTNYTSYFTKSGSTYNAVTGAAAPTFATNTYYSKYDDGTNYAWKSSLSSGTSSDWDRLGGSFEINKITKADIDAMFAS